LGNPPRSFVPWLIKIDSFGDTIWTKTYMPHSPSKQSVYQTGDGGYIIIGATGIVGMGYQGLLIKTNNIGDTLWTKNFGGIKDERCYSLKQTSDGGYIIVGYTNSYGAGDSDVYLVKTYPSGNIEWAKTYGGQYHNRGYDVQVTSDYGYIIAAIAVDEYNHGYAWLIKTDSLGSLIPSSMNQNPIIPTVNELKQNYPNPFNLSTNIQFSLSNISQVEIKIYNSLGQQIKALVNEKKSKGNHSITWDGTNLIGQSIPSGIYIYELLINGNKTESKKMLLIK